MIRCTVCRIEKLEDNFSKRTNGKFRSHCKKCSSNISLTAQSSKRKKAKDLFGNVCSICGYNKCLSALEFHHTNGDKEFNLNKGFKSYSWEKIEEEIKKCILICSNCHRELHERRHPIVVN